MSARTETFVIVGASSAGGAAAATLRSEGFEGRVILIGEEPHPPYERPPLSKEYLRGEVGAQDTYLQPEEWYAGHDVDLQMGVRAGSIDIRGRRILLEDGRSMAFDRALMATGGRNSPLAVPGKDLEGVFGLRTFADADGIRRAARLGTRAAVVGAGFIGCEVAASLRHAGVEVEVVEFLDAPMLRALGPELGRLFAAIHRDHGVQLHMGQAVLGFEGRDRVEAVRTASGNRIECDFAVVGVGIDPATEAVEGTGVRVENGIAVDQWCRTNVPGIYAAGDVANQWHPLFERRLRVEHWDNALKQGAAAARAMVADGRGAPAQPFADPHWFWSDQYEHNLQYLGYAPEWDEFVVRGSLRDREFVGFYLQDGVVLAVVGLDRGKDVRRARSLVQSRRQVDPVALKDPDVDLRTLGREG